MINPMMMQKISPVINMVKYANNPQAAIGNLLMTNPYMKSVMECVNSNGGDPEKAFYQKAQEMGIDPEEILKAMRNA